NFYQYWINTDDRDVERFLAYFTLLPMDEVHKLGQAKDAALQESKAVLAFEATKLCHGEAEAENARKASRAAFGHTDDDMSAIPTRTVARAVLANGIPLVDLLIQAGLAKSKNEARRLITQGGAYLNREPVQQIDAVVREEAAAKGAILLGAGKK